MLAFALGLTVVTALLFGLVPALKLSRRAEDDQHDAGGRRPQRRAAVETRRAVAHRRRGRARARPDDRRRPDPAKLREARVRRSGIQRRPTCSRSRSSRSIRPPRIRRDYYASLADALRQLPEVASAGAIDQTGLERRRHVLLPPRRIPACQFDGRSAPCCRATSKRWASAPWRGRLLEDADRVTGEAVVDQRHRVPAVFRRQRGRPHAPDRRQESASPAHRRRRARPAARWSARAGTAGDVRAARSEGCRTRASMQLAMVMRLREGMSLSIDRLKQMAESVGPARPRRATSGRRRRCSASR